MFLCFLFFSSLPFCPSFSFSSTLLLYISKPKNCPPLEVRGCCLEWDRERERDIYIYVYIYIWTEGMRKKGQRERRAKEKFCQLSSISPTSTEDHLQRQISIPTPFKPGTPPPPSSQDPSPVLPAGASATMNLPGKGEGARGQVAAFPRMGGVGLSSQEPSPWLNLKREACLLTVGLCWVGGLPQGPFSENNLFPLKVGLRWVFVNGLKRVQNWVFGRENGSKVGRNPHFTHFKPISGFSRNPTVLASLRGVEIVF